MENTDNSSKGRLYSDSAYMDSENKSKIEGLASFICKNYNSNEVNEYFKNVIDIKIIGKRMTIEEYAKMLNEDELLKIILAGSNQSTLKKIHFWIKLWSVLSIILAIIYFIYLIMNSSSYY